MSERCILAVRFTGAGSTGQVGRAVGGFLRYVQHRDLHPTPQSPAMQPKVQGLLKYVAYRDQTNVRAELFGPLGIVGSEERKALAAFVVRSLEESRPQLYRNRQGQMVDRRRAVYRMVLSPERAQGLDLSDLTRAAVARLEREISVSGLHWVAAVHRNTAHPHVHLVLAGMCQTEDGYRRVDLTKPRLAVMKEAIALEIQRQRGERTAEPRSPLPSSDSARNPIAPPRVAARPSRVRLFRVELPKIGPRTQPRVRLQTSVLRLWAAGLRYRRQMEHAAADEARRHGWEYAA